jgi:hypothetical protein
MARKDLESPQNLSKVFLKMVVVALKPISYNEAFTALSKKSFRVKICGHCQ